MEDKDFVTPFELQEVTVQLHFGCGFRKRIAAVVSTWGRVGETIVIDVLCMEKVITKLFTLTSQ